MSSRARGADFSSAQTIAEVSAALDQHIEFAFVKASEGIGYRNPLLAQQAETLRARRVLVGYYHYLDPRTDGSTQWDHFEASITGLRRGPVALDYEAAGTTDAQARAFIRRGRQRGYRVGLYGSPRLFTRRRRLQLGRPAWAWVASWSQTRPAVRFDVWQFTDGGGRQDYDQYKGGSVDLRVWWSRQTRPLKRKPTRRWWLHDEASPVVLGPFRLATVAPAFLAYALKHRHSSTYTLVRK